MYEQRMSTPRPLERVIAEISPLALTNLIRKAGVPSLVESKRLADDIIAAAKAEDRTIMLERWQ